jgi:TatD DNase family protein
VIDIGVNLTNAAFRDDCAGVIARASTAGIARMVVTGTSLTDSRAAIDLCRRWPERLVCTAGIHPHDAARVPLDWRQQLEDMLTDAAVRAVGETGLDFNRNFAPRDAQLALFHAQIEMAIRARKPLFVHDRDTRGTTADVLAEHRAALNAAGIAVVIHCFTGSAAELARYLADGFAIGITGWVCDERRGRELQELVPEIPDDRLMIETDAPFLTPRTMPRALRARRNEPANLVWIARMLAELRGQSQQQVERITSANAARFFGLASA